MTVVEQESEHPSEAEPAEPRDLKEPAPARETDEDTYRVHPDAPAV